MIARRYRRLTILLLASLLLPLTALAHSNSKSFLVMNSLDTGRSEWQVRWDLSFQDLDLVLNLDRNLDGQLTRAELDRAGDSLAALPARLLKFSMAGQSCTSGPVGQKLSQKPAGKMMRLQFDLRCPGQADTLELNYRLLAGVDASHRGLLEIAGQSQIIKPGVTTRLAGTGPAQADSTQAFLSFVVSGVGHILAGWDHLAFLVALLIPVLLSGHAQGNPPYRHRIKRLFWVVTAFTLAHSLTLCLAVLDLITLPAGPVEAAIAASIVIAALASLLNRGASVTVPMAFLFGLLHGFGFANVMGDAGASGHAIAFGLLGFNLGVEVGQLIFIGLLLPVFWVVARMPKLAGWIAPVLSALLVVLGTSWFIERIPSGNWI